MVFQGEEKVDQSNASNLWHKACKHLKTVLHNDVYSRWIAIIEPVDLSDHTLTLSVDNDFYQSWLEDNYLPLIEKALASCYDDPLNIVFSIKNKPLETDDSSKAKPKKTIRERLSSSRHIESTSLNPKFTMDEFIVGPSNNFAHAASIAVAQAPARAYNPLFIYGGVGLGKTHLMQAIGHSVLHSSRARVCYLSSEALLNEYIDALQNRKLVQFRKKYRTVDLLLIDDIHFLAGKERIQEEFFHTFNALFDSHKQIVMTSDRPASEIKGLEKRLVSRFEGGLVTEMELPDLETRIAILRHKQEQMEYSLSEDKLLFIAENIRSNVRRLEGALIRSVSYSSLTKRELTIDSMKRLLHDTLDKEQSTETTFSSIQKVVAEHYDIRLADMTSNRRPRSIAMPRQVAMFLCRKMTRASFPDIANAFGKTHATILHACKSIDNRMDVETNLRSDIDNLTRKLGQPVS